MDKEMQKNRKGSTIYYLDIIILKTGWAFVMAGLPHRLDWVQSHPDTQKCVCEDASRKH